MISTKTGTVYLGDLLVWPQRCLRSLHSLLQSGGTATPVTVLDISSMCVSDGDRGILEIAVHPQFVQNNYFYVLYTHS